MCSLQRRGSNPLDACTYSFAVICGVSPIAMLMTPCEGPAPLAIQGPAQGLGGFRRKAVFLRRDEPMGLEFGE